MADQKITQLAELTAANIADVLAIVDDVAGTPVTKFITALNLLRTGVDYRDFTEDDSVGTPASGDSRLSVATDGKAYLTDDAGNKVAVGEGALAHKMCGRLTLTSGTAITTSDVTGASSIYYTPMNGNTLRMYDSALGAWKNLTFSELEFEIEDVQSCTLVNGDATVTVENSSLLVVGMEITGTGVPALTTISSITDGTTIEMSANATM